MTVKQGLSQYVYEVVQFGKGTSKTDRLEGRNSSKKESSSYLVSLLGNVDSLVQVYIQHSTSKSVSPYMLTRVTCKRTHALFPVLDNL